MNTPIAPLYLKSKDGNWFMKCNWSGPTILINKETNPSGANLFTIRFSNDSDVSDAMALTYSSDQVTEDSDRNEFETIYGQAQYVLCKINCEQ